MQIQQHWHQVHILSVTTTHTNTVQHGGMQIQQHWHQVHVLSVTTTCTNNREIIAEFWEMRFGSHRYYVTKKSLAQCSYTKNPEMFNLNLWFVCTRMLNCNCLDLQWLTDSYIPSTVSPSKWGGPDACHQRRLWGGSEGTVPTRAHRCAGERCKNIGSCHLSPPRFHPRCLATGVIASIT